MFSGRCLRVRPSSELNPLFLYYYFRLEETKKFVRNIAVGATMPSINTKLLGEVEIAYPDINTQDRIASILSAIDTKIEVNEKINDNLAAWNWRLETSISPDMSLGSRTSLIAAKRLFSKQLETICITIGNVSASKSSKVEMSGSVISKAS